MIFELILGNQFKKASWMKGKTFFLAFFPKYYKKFKSVEKLKTGDFKT